MRVIAPSILFALATIASPVSAQDPELTDSENPIEAESSDATTYYRCYSTDWWGLGHSYYGVDLDQVLAARQAYANCRHFSNVPGTCSRATCEYVY